MTTGRVLCAPDKLRGSLSAAGAASAMAAGAADAGLEPVEHPLADGGEGTRLLLEAAIGGREEAVLAADPLGRRRAVPVSLLADGSAVVEVAEVVGLAGLGAGERTPLRASSAGVGEAMLAALDLRPARIVVTLGGSATVDGGLGMLRAVGIRLLDAAGRELCGTGADLADLAELDRSDLDARLPATELVGALDVMSPLHGPDGAARVFGPQKGADAETVERLDEGLRRLAALLGPAGVVPGAGAAGGLGAALAALGAELRPGADLVMDATRFDESLARCDLCLTGEGRIDGSTLAGKTAARVAAHCAEAGVPCVVLGGSVELDDPERALGVSGVLAVGPGPQTLEEALAGAEGALRRTARAACGIFVAGRDSAGVRERRP